ncbi:hypothetical protein WG936_06820 [Corynebacterium sp. H127]|uniref:hypothetical protein n=1 Tax=Corynebacterium sp. H127 TaxID=3133418 RepID=UPI0030B046F6
MRIRHTPIILGIGLSLVLTPMAQAEEVNPELFKSSWGDNGAEFSTPESEYCRISEDMGPEGAQYVVCRTGETPEAIVGVITGEPAFYEENPPLPFNTMTGEQPALLNPGQELTVGAGRCMVTAEQGTVCNIDDNGFTLPMTEEAPAQ